MGRPTTEASRVRREPNWRRDENVRIDIFSCYLDVTLKTNSDGKVVNMKVLRFFRDEQLCFLQYFDLRSFTAVLPQSFHARYCQF